MAATSDVNMQCKGIGLGSWERDSSGNVVTTGYRAPSSFSSSSDKPTFIQTTIVEISNEALQALLNQRYNKCKKKR